MRIEICLNPLGSVASSPSTTLNASFDFSIQVAIFVNRARFVVLPTIVVASVCRSSGCAMEIGNAMGDLVVSASLNFVSRLILVIVTTEVMKIYATVVRQSILFD